jgi:DNA-binding NtrC family response regulator
MIDQPGMKILIAEDEELLAGVLEQFLVGHGHEVSVVHDGRAALEAIRRDNFDVALLDIVMPELDGLEVLRQLSDEPAPPEVIIITGNGTIETAITAIRLGAYDYLSKPYRMAEIDVLVRRAWEKRQLSQDNALLQGRLERSTAAPEVVTHYPPMQEALALVERVAASKTPVLITGEPGTGKRLVARVLHRLSGRAGGSLVEVDCAAVAGSPMECELFGHEKGAFPGAVKRKIGLAELASEGTLFLNEVADLDPKAQGRMLRALETGGFVRAGGTHKVDFTARIAAATERDLQAAVIDRSFRSDLFYRINTITIALPPLRERAVDISVLAEHFLKEFGGGIPLVLTEDAIAALQAYSWPGNVRELRNVIERAVLLSPPGGVITRRDLPLATGSQATPGRDGDGQHLSLADLERRHIEATLLRTNWHQGRAATQLGISSKTLYRKIREYGFARPRR